MSKSGRFLLILPVLRHTFSIFFFTYPTSPELYTLSLHDALPIFAGAARERGAPQGDGDRGAVQRAARCTADRKSTRLNSSHTVISYAVFCLKKKKTSANHN